MSWIILNYNTAIQVITLFDGHYDLIEEFGKFVPPTEPEP